MIAALYILLALWTVDPSETAAVTPAARFEQGRALFDSGRYGEAAAIFVDLHAETGEASVLYAAGQSFRLASKCQDALAAYQSFVTATGDVQRRSVDTPTTSTVRPPVTDLDYARARIIEMRICAARSRSHSAREQATRLATADRAAALAILENDWQQTSDPTILPPLVRLQRQMGTCQLATSRLHAAIEALRPIDALADAALADSDVTAARDALSELRRIETGEPCVSLALAAPPRDDAFPNGASGSAVPARTRWALWTMLGAGALIAAGGVSGALMYRTEGKLDAYGRDNRPWDARGGQLQEEGQRYQLGAIVLTATGVVVGAVTVLLHISAGVRVSGQAHNTERATALDSIGAL